MTGVISRYLIAFALLIGATYALFAFGEMHGADLERTKQAQAAGAAIQEAVKAREVLEAQIAERANVDHDQIETLQAQLDEARTNAEKTQAQTAAAPAGRDCGGVVFDESWSAWLSNDKPKRR